MRLYGLLMVFCAVLVAEASAADYYSVTTHQSKAGYIMMTLTAFTERDSCEETAQARNAPMDDNWAIVASRCAARNSMLDEQLAMFKREQLKDPYLAFVDIAGYDNVVGFTNVPPVVLDAMIWKWSEGLKEQRMNNVVIVMDAKRKKLNELVREAKRRMQGMTQLTSFKLSKRSEAGLGREPFVPTHQLVLKSGHLLKAMLIQERKEGLWLRVDEGIELLFTRDEIEDMRPL